ncbi:hypothetical protein ACFE04_015037 [Oxalis oulophora]
MSDKVFPSAKPASNDTINPTATTTKNGSHLLNPTSRIPYRPSQSRQGHRRHSRSFCKVCCFWSFLVLLLLALLAAISGSILYLLYHPHRPEFTVNSLRISRLNLTVNSDSSVSHLSTLFNLTVTSKNPNSHITFKYDDFIITCTTSNSDVFIGNGSIPAFVSGNKNQTSFRTIISGDMSNIDVDSVTTLRSDMKKRNGVPLKLQIDTKVVVKIGEKIKSEKVAIRVTCEDIKGIAPQGKSTSVANVANALCKVDLRIKIWKFSF